MLINQTQTTLYRDTLVFIKYLQRFFHDVFWKGGENIEVKVFTYLNV